MSETITTPVGRLVEGSLYQGSDRDVNGQPKLFKKGKNVGQPRYDFYFALAIKKGHEIHWNQTDWGQVIDRVAKTAFPQGQWQHPDFSWKVVDGDSTILNKGKPPRRPCDKEGFRGHWVLKFSRPFAPKIYNFDGSQQLLEENYVNPGDYIQVHALVDGNNSAQQPGMYLNHLMIAFAGYGERIVLAADPKSVGFGQSPLPAGASTTPLAAFVPPVSQIATPPMPASYPQILTPPPVAAAPAPLAPPQRVMSPTAQGTYEQYRAAGWTDEQLIQNGLMVTCRGVAKMNNFLALLAGALTAILVVFSFYLMEGI